MPTQQAEQQAVQDSAKQQRRRSRSVRTLRLLGWSAFICLAGSKVVESTDIPRKLVQLQLERALGADAGEVQLDALDVHWSDRSVELRGLHYGDLLSLDRVLVTLGSSPPSMPPVERILIEGGEFILGDELERALDRIRQVQQSGDTGWIPTLKISNLGLQLVRIDAVENSIDRIQLGRLDGHLTKTEQGRMQLSARILRERGPARKPERVSLSASERDDGRLRVTLTGRELDLGSDYWVGAWLGKLREFAPKALLHLDATADVALPGEGATSALPLLHSAELNASLRDGQLQLPFAWELPTANDSAQLNPEVLSAIKLDLQSRLSPVAPGVRRDWLDPMQWATRLECSAKWIEQQLAVAARAGQAARSGSRLEAWIETPRTEFTPELRTLLDSLPAAAELIGMLEPEGAYALSAGFRIPLEARAGLDFREQIPLTVSIRPLEDCSFAYHGNVGPLGRVYGFPLRMRDTTGRVLLSEAGRIDIPYHSFLGIIAVAGQTIDGAHIEVEASSHSFSPVFVPDSPIGRVSFRMHAKSPDLEVSDAVSQALEGLTGIVAREVAWDNYGPVSGKLPVDVSFWRDESRPRLAMRLTIGIEQAQMNWSPLPLPMRDVNGRVAISTDGRDSTRESSHFATHIQASASHPAMRTPIELDLYSLTGRRRDTLESMPIADPIANQFRLSIEGLNPKHSALRAVVEQSMPKLEQTIRDIAPQGFFDLSIVRNLEPGAGRGRTLLEIETAEGENRIRPAAFDMLTSAVKGRAIVAWKDPEDPQVTESFAPDVLAIPIIGRWGTAVAPIPVGAHIALGNGGDVELELFGAGVPLANAALLSTFGRTLNEGASDSDIDLSRTGMDGQLDVGGKLSIRGKDSNRRITPNLNLFLRDGTLAIASLDERPFLERMRGRVRLDDQGLREAQIEALLRDTPIRIGAIAIETVGSATVISCDLTLRNFPIDREHLEPFLDRTTLRTVLEDLQWKGLLSVEQGRLSITFADESSEPVVSFRGTVEVSEMSGVLGVPVTVSSARLDPLHMVLEGTDLRLWARLRNLYGTLADRRLSDASLLTTYVHPHLSIRELEGEFEGGSLQSMGLEAGGSADFFSLDLVPPFHFRLAAIATGVDTGELTRGVFNSSFANRGELDASLALEGDLGKLLSIRGSGHVKLSNSSLWAIPVFQQLFAQLGFDTTAIFRRMECRVTVADGSIEMRDMSLKSDLLSLVGKGKIDFDGRMRHDLDVRYSLIDRLGPLTLLLYKIQEGLLHVSIRGDLSRPRVLLGGILSLFIGTGDEQGRELPLPGSSSLPDHF
ncbi:MAG: hypothetical protein ACI841_002709 [Planctomycetota bacterium]|jgi:hypothetical protein